jgi:radical SAM protein with 4Fe4S-binding SPASM domain
MKRLVKQSLLKWGGYDLARRVYKLAERQALKAHVRTFRKTGRMPLPERVIFEPTQRCNLRCRMCWQDRAELSSGHEMTLADILSFFDATPYLKKVTLIGGEVFVRKDFLELLVYLNRSRDLVISTNGTRVDRGVLAVLQSMQRIYTICISLDGDRALHDSIRGVPGAFDRAAEAVGRLAPHFPVTVNCVILPQNLEVLPDLVGMCAGLGARKVKLELERRYTADKIEETVSGIGTRPERLPFPSESLERGYSRTALQQRLAMCREQARERGIYLATDPPFLSRELDACYLERLRSANTCVCRHFQTATVTPEGDVVNCAVIRQPFGNIGRQRLADIWNSPSATAFRRRLIAQNMTMLCENCPHLVPVGRI